MKREQFDAGFRYFHITLSKNLQIDCYGNIIFNLDEILLEIGNLARSELILVELQINDNRHRTLNLVREFITKKLNNGCFYSQTKQTVADLLQRGCNILFLFNHDSILRLESSDDPEQLFLTVSKGLVQRNAGMLTVVHAYVNPPKFAMFGVIFTKFFKGNLFFIFIFLNEKN